MRIAIVGLGISGATIARVLYERNFKEIYLFEKETSSGGLISCSIEEGNLYHKVGGHVFNSKIDVVNEWFWEHFDKEEDFVKSKRNASIRLNDKFINYPIENNLKQLDDVTLRKIISELININFCSKEKNKEIIYQNFEDFLLNNFGNTLYEIYFKPYNQKIWNTDLSKIPMSWLDGKLPMPNHLDIFFSNIKYQKTNMVHDFFYYPKKGGSQFIIDRLLKNLDFDLNKEIKNIVLKNGKINLNNIFFDSLIYTGDIRNLSSIINGISIEDKNILNNLKDLKVNKISNALCEIKKNEYSWIYLPSEKYKAHRIIMTGNFSPNNNNVNLSADNTTCTVEFSGELTKEEISKQLDKMPFELKPIAFNIGRNAYVIQDSDTREKVIKAKKILEKYNIFLSGRFAEWEYMNMDIAIHSAFKTFEKINRLKYKRNL